MYRVPERICRTADGRLVREGDPQAAFLAYPAGAELSDEEAERFGLLALGTDAKLGSRPQDKLARRGRDKAAGRQVAPGVVADTSIDGEAHVLVPEPGSPLRNGVDK